MAETKILKSNRMGWAIFFAIAFTITSCFSPSSKESYLAGYERFVDNVQKNHLDYTKSDWEYADKRFKKFSQEWYDRFNNDLSLGEQVKTMSLATRYVSYKGKSKVEEFSDDIFRKDAKDMKEKIQYYLDHDMDEDLQKLKEGAKEIGDSTLSAVEEIIRDLKGH
jgi:hypothetical protein